MKRTLQIASPLALLTAAAMLASSSALCFENEPTGFRGVSWNSAIEDNQATMREISDFDLHKIYERSGDKLEIGGAALASIGYDYYKGHFRAVIMTSKGIANCRSLRDAFFAQFGKGDQPNQFIEKYTWLGSEAFIIYNKKVINEECSASIASRRVVAAETQDQKAKAAGSAKDF